MPLLDQIRIARRFQRSIRIDTDLGDIRALEGFVCPESFAGVLRTMVGHISQSQHSAFTWTGPYGSGKSSLVIAFSALLNGNAGLQRQAINVFGKDLSRAIHKALPCGAKGWRVVPVVGRRDDPTRVIGEAIQAAGLVEHEHKDGRGEPQLVTTLLKAAKRKPKTHGGLILFIDEMGKFLEAATQDGVDIYLFQQLAEAASRSNRRLIVIGVLHQAFEEYAHLISQQRRDEWAKVQGRFVDLAVSTASDEQIEIISRAIEYKHEPNISHELADRIATIALRKRPADAQRLASALGECWPLHPVVACLLGPISRRRFGQNQRSIFGFLNSSEPHGFQNFLSSAQEDELYQPSKLWDYLRANLEPSILASPDGHRWSLAAEVLERCEAIGGDSLHLDLLKTIAVVDLFKERSGLVPSFELLHACFPQCSDVDLKKALAQLKDWSFIIFKKFLNAYAVFAGSDFDIDLAVRIALDNVSEIDYDELKTLTGLQPILAKRHYHDTGSLRWFDINLTPIQNVVTAATNFTPKNAIIGQFLLAIPTENESHETAGELCREAARCSKEWDVVVGISKHSWEIVLRARELVALEAVRNDRPELQGDAVARREVAARMAELQGRLEFEMRKAFDEAVWYRKWHREPKPYRHAELNGLASDLADRRFTKCPRLHNELLNRQKPSGSAISAQNKLLNHMVVDEGQPRLGIRGFPAEGGLSSSILESTGIYTEEGTGWCFKRPGMDQDDTHRLQPIWEAAEEYLKNNTRRTVAVSEIYNLWSKQPYGVKDGLMPVLMVAFILSQRNEVTVYRDGIFRARFDDVDVQYLAKDPAFIQLRWMELSDVSRRLLTDMAEVVRSLDQNNTLIHLEPIDVGRGLVAIHDTLPLWTKRTMRLSSNANQVRELFKRAKDPNQFIFDDIPALFETDLLDASADELKSIVSNISEGLEELIQAYPSMLQRLRELLLSELQVPNSSPQSLSELRDRAANISQLAGEFQLNAFVVRLARFDDSDRSIEELASLAGKKPPHNWVDLDVDRAAIELADMAQSFLRIETFSRVKGRPEKREAMAVFVGVEGRPTPIHEEFDVADTDRREINALIERLASALENADTSRRTIILAALAELSVRYMEQPTKAKKSRKNIGRGNG